MDVWVVEKYNSLDRDSETVAVFSTEDKAYDYIIKKNGKDVYESYGYEKYEVDKE